MPSNSLPLSLYGEAATMVKSGGTRDKDPPLNSCTPLGIFLATLASSFSSCDLGAAPGIVKVEVK